MSSQNNLEQTIKKIHLMVSESPRVKGNPDQVVIDKRELFGYLEEISQCMYGMLDEYKLTTAQKDEQMRQIQQEEKRMIESATIKVEDIYSASTLYADNAIGRMVRILEESQKSFDLLYADFNRRMAEEKSRLRGNQKELEEQLFDMRDSNLYLNILSDCRRQIENAQDKKQKNSASSLEVTSYSAPDIKINKAYFEKMGLDTEGMPMKGESSEVKTQPEVIVNTESNYFKWKNGKEIDNPFAKKKGAEDATGKPTER